jgi:putative membrane protein
MSESMSPEKIAEMQLGMARSRTLLALDRTLLAWVRTSLTLMGFGFTLARFVHDLLASGTFKGMAAAYPRDLGILLVVLGVLGLFGGAWEYVRAAKQLQGSLKVTVWSVTLVLTLVLAIVGTVMLVNLVTLTVDGH